MGKRGQPKIGEDFEILVYIKIVQYCNRYNIGPMKAWEKLTTHLAIVTGKHFTQRFPDLFPSHDQVGEYAEQVSQVFKFKKA